MEMHQVRYFVALCETLNFTRAAEKCNVTQPSLTRAIKLLEDELGGPLFNRERNQTHLTELGQIDGAASARGARPEPGGAGAGQQLLRPAQRPAQARGRARGHHGGAGRHAPAFRHGLSRHRDRHARRSPERAARGAAPRRFRARAPAAAGSRPGRAALLPAGRGPAVRDPAGGAPACRPGARAVGAARRGGPRLR